MWSLATVLVMPCKDSRKSRISRAISTSRGPVEASGLIIVVERGAAGDGQGAQPDEVRVDFVQGRGGLSGVGLPEVPAAQTRHIVLRELQAGLLHLLSRR